MQFERGRFLRRRYADLLGPNCSPDKVHVRSTDAERTYVSAQYNTAGIFAPEDVQWQDALQWQLVNISVPIPFDNDTFLVQSSTPSCELVTKIQTKYLQSDEVQKQYNSTYSLRTFLEAHSGQQILEMDYFYIFYDPLNLERNVGLKYVLFIQM